MPDGRADRFVIEALFTTVTNVDFDPQRLKGWIDQAYRVKEDLKEKFLDCSPGRTAGRSPASFPKRSPSSRPGPWKGLLKQGAAAGIMANPQLNPDIRSLRELLTYGLKGMAAYADHAAHPRRQRRDGQRLLLQGPGGAARRQPGRRTPCSS